MRCSLCDSKNIEHVFNAHNTHGRFIIDAKVNYKIFRCRGCKSVFIDNIITDEKYYRDNYSLNYYDNDGKNNFLYHFLSSFLIKFSAKNKEGIILDFSGNKNKKMSILDFGCGDGSFLSNLDKNRFDIYGVEINPEGVKICLEKNLRVYDQDILKIDFKEKKFDIITLWHVVEHIKNPIQVFNKLNNLLEKDGILLISTPNTDGIGFKYGKGDWFHLDSPRHLILYNEKSLKKLCLMTNFKIIKIKNGFYEFPLDLFWSLKKWHIHFLLLPFYLLLKIIKPETLTIICKKI